MSITPDTQTSPGSFAKRGTPLSNLDFGDMLFFFYALVFVRQYLWIISNNIAGWTIAALLTLVIWWFYLKTKPLPAERCGRQFWIVVALPLVVIYFLRAMYPDISFDVLNYRLLHSERSLRGPLFLPGDFFPTPAPYNPSPDTLTGLFRIALGYRLGTIVNLLALIWSAQIIYKLLRPSVTRRWLRAFFVLLIVLAEQVLFEVNNYMVDLLALPLLFEATRLALDVDDGLRSSAESSASSAVFPDVAAINRREQTEGYAESAEENSNCPAENRTAVYVHAALLLGMSAGLKLTNVTAVVPLAAIFFYKGFVSKNRLALASAMKTTALSSLIFLLPLLPFSIYLWRVTGNPVFPLANRIFKSPYWPVTGGWDARWGPVGLVQSTLWPVWSTLRPDRFSELGVYSGRILVGFAVAIVGTVLLWRNVRVRELCLLFLGGCLLWSFVGMGYSRYGLYLELLAGVVVVIVIAELMKQATAWSNWRTALAAIFFVALAIQVSVACFLISKYEWSMRGTVIDHRLRYTLRETSELFRDRDLNEYLSPDDQLAVTNVGAWVDTTFKTTGFMALLKPDAPIMGARAYEYFASQPGRDLFEARIAGAQGRRLFTLADPASLQDARDTAAKRGLTFIAMRPITIPFYSDTTKFGLVLVELSPATSASANAVPVKNMPLPDKAFRAQIQVSNPPLTMRAGEKYVLDVTLQNASKIAWPGQQPTWQYQITVADRWLKPDGTKVNDLDGRAALAEDLAPANTATLRLTVTAPASPGDYVLEFDVVQEGVAWFGDHGSPTARFNVRVN